MYFDRKISSFITGKATIANLGNSYEKESSNDKNDWTYANYTNRPSISLKNLYVEAGRDNFSGGAGIRALPKREGLVNALKDIEYQFFPVDARDPLKMRWIGIPGVWGKVNFSKDSYCKIMWYESHWSKISPQAVPELKHRNFESPTGDKGYSLFSSFGSRIDDFSMA